MHTLDDVPPAVFGSHAVVEDGVEVVEVVGGVDDDRLGTGHPQIDQAQHRVEILQPVYLKRSATR